MRSNQHAHISDMMDYMMSRQNLKNLAALDHFCEAHGLGYGSRNEPVIYITYTADDNTPVWLSVVNNDGRIEHDFDAPVSAVIMNELTEILTELINANSPLFSQSLSA